MKNKVIALTLAAVLALSSTSVFATEETKLESKNSNYNNLKNYISEIISGKLKVQSVNINGKIVDLNSIDWNTLLKTAKTEKVVTETEKPVINKPQVQKPAKSQQADVKLIKTQPVATKPAAQETSPVKEENNGSPDTAVVS